MNKTGRPILIGTRSVEESEYLASNLSRLGVHCQVLNAKNDEQEAEIVEKAGSFGAITVSTNMAGRGTDIKLGGDDESDRDKIVELGGLYVIGTNKHESRRIDNQLRGRAGRQGDPGSSRFFISMEDELMKKYNLDELITRSFYPESQDQPIENRIVKREINRAQRIIEGQNFYIRKSLSKYSIIMNQQWQMIYKLRMDILTGRITPGLMKENLSDMYAEISKKVGEAAIVKAETQLILYFVYNCWSDYLDFLSYTKETIHLVNVAGKEPISEFNKIAIEAYENLLNDFKEQTLNALLKANIDENGINMKKEGLNAPSSTWTYIVDDNPEQLGMINLPIVFDPLTAILAGVSMAWIARKKFSPKKTKKRLL